MIIDHIPEVIYTTYTDDGFFQRKHPHPIYEHSSISHPDSWTISVLNLYKRQIFIIQHTPLSDITSFDIL